MRTAILACAAALLLAAAPAAAGQGTVSFATRDGCRIEAFYQAPSSGSFVFINTHGLGSDRHEWASFQDALKAAGYGWLSLDLRGHGGSLACGGKPADYRKFGRADWAAASRDIEAAAAWLKKKGFSGGRLVFCGASVGANLSLKAAAEGAVKPAAVIMLSPGLDYAGIKPGEFMARAPQKIFIAAAEDDPYAWQSAMALARAGRGRAVTAADGGSGHGVAMFRSPATIEKILSWVRGL